MIPARETRIPSAVDPLLLYVGFRRRKPHFEYSENAEFVSYSDFPKRILLSKVGNLKVMPEVWVVLSEATPPDVEW
jgi:hypothetical protein